MTRVMLIQPPSNIMANRMEGKPALPPYGLACIGGVLRAAGHEVQIYDMLTEGYFHETPYPGGQFIRYGDGKPELYHRLDSFKPDVVGVSCIASLRHFDTCDVVKWVKYYDRTITTVVGGNHPTCFPDMMFRDCGGALDHVVMAEGEQAMLDIVEGRATTNIVHCPERTDLDKMPLPAHDLLPLDKYVEVWRKSNYHFYDVKGRFIITSDSRGCVNRCEHCPHEVVFGKGWRPRKVADIMKEVEYATRELDVKEIQFHEYNGQVSKKFMMDISKGIKKYNVRWGYPIGMWVRLLDKKMLEAMYDSGMDYINLAIESPQETVLDTMPGKDVDLNYVDKVIKWCNEIGYYINCFFMIGFPEQTLADMQRTVDYAVGRDIDTAVFFIMQPLPGTPQYDRAEFIEGFHPMMLRYGKCNNKSPNWVAEQVEEIRHEGRKKLLAKRVEQSGDSVRGGNFIKRGVMK